MVRIDKTAVIRNRARVRIGRDVTVMEYAVVGAPNLWPNTFQKPEQRRVTLEDGVVIYPHCVVFEGATLGRKVVLEERTSVGSRTTIGAGTRILYQSQVNDNVIVGSDCRIGGFVADNSRIGRRCKVFGALVHPCSDPRPWEEGDEEGPTLEDGVLIGWGAVLVGSVRVGAGARIGPNCTIVGPARIAPGARVGPNSVVTAYSRRRGRT